MSNGVCACALVVSYIRARLPLTGTTKSFALVAATTSSLKLQAALIMAEPAHATDPQ